MTLERANEDVFTYFQDFSDLSITPASLSYKGGKPVLFAGNQ